MQHKHDTVNVGRAELITGTLLGKRALNIGCLRAADGASGARFSRMWVGTVRQTPQQHLQVMKFLRKVFI